MKKILLGIIVAILSAAIITSLVACNKPIKVMELKINSPDLMVGAKVVNESLTTKEKADAVNMLSTNDKCWTPANNSKFANVEFKLNGEKTFNTAVITEVGDEVQYFRLQAYVDGEWKTLHTSEKMGEQRIISFDSVKSSKLRLSIEKFKGKEKTSKIKNIKLYNLESDRKDNFNTTVYQRIDIVRPSEILHSDKAETYARYYDVYNTVIVFDAVTWDEKGKLIFKNDGVDGLTGEQYFKKEISAIKDLVSMCNNHHKVRIIVTALADGAGGSHEGVNTLMHANHTKIATEMVNTFIKSEEDGGYDLDGLDIDWEYPQNKKDWACYDTFMKELDEKMSAVKPDAIISAALSAWALGMSKDTMKRIDQIQYMAYDDFDSDGDQSTIYNAQLGVARFVENGATLNKINIGIPSYGRPVGGGPFWPDWYLVENANYFDSRYNGIKCDDASYRECSFCSPALAGDKTALALFSGCGGVMVFRLNCDKLMDDPNAVACGIENTMKRYISGWGNNALVK